MADLRILEAQQQESEGKLQQARVTKQRRLDYQTALEEKLDKCKYQNGQLAAELHRSQELLSEGHCQLNEARKVSIKVGNDIRDYDSKVNNAISIKASIVAHQRTQDGWLHMLQKKVLLIDDVLHESKLQFEKAQSEFEQAKQFERTLRSDIKCENDAQVRIVDQTTKLSTDIAAYERNFEALESLQANLKQKIHTLEKEKMVDLDSRHSKLMATFNTLQAEKEKLRDEYAAEQDKLKDQIKKMNDELHRLWHGLVEIQKSEGHDQSPLPSESDSLPVLDLERIRQTLQVELEAVKSEQKAKYEIDESIRELSKQLSDLQLRHKDNMKHIAELQASNTDAAEREKSRSESIALFMQRYDEIRKVVDEKEALVRARQADHKIEMSVLNGELESLANEVNLLKTSFDTCVSKNRALDDEILSIRANHDKLKGSDEMKLMQMQDELERVRSSIVALQKEAMDPKSSSKYRSTERSGFSVDEEKRRRRHMDEAQQRIASILKGTIVVSSSVSAYFCRPTISAFCFQQYYGIDYPELESLRFNYRPDLSDHEQALVDLKKFKQKCNMRDRITEAKLAALENGKSVLSEHDHGQAEVEGIRLKELSKQGETLLQESTSKPRALLTKFVHASQSDDKENENGNENSDNLETTGCQQNDVKPRKSLLPDDWTHHSEKKVRWQQDNSKLKDVKKMKRTETKTHSETTFSSLRKSKGLLSRQSFGSTDQPETSDHTKGKNEEREKVMARGARASASYPLSTTKEPKVSTHMRSEEKASSFSMDSKKRISSAEKVSSFSVDSKKLISSTGKVSSFSVDSKKRTSSSRQSSGISSQERSSKLGRRRKRSSQSGGASVGSKSVGRTNFDDDEYNFNFTKS